MQAQQPRSAEIHPGPGFRVRTDFPRLAPELMSELANFETPDLSDLLNRLYAIDPGITCLTPAADRLHGPACTVRVYPGDNLMVHKVLDVAKPGDVVVISAGGGLANAVLGDVISNKALHREIAGFVIDGLVRDLPGIQSLGLPVFARGATPIGPLHRGPGEINYPIACGHVVVNPGDVVVADGAGVVVIPRPVAADLLERVSEYKANTAEYLAGVRRGEFSNAWVDTQLARQGCVIDGEVPSAHVAPIASV